MSRRVIVACIKLQEVCNPALLFKKNVMTNKDTIFSRMNRYLKQALSKQEEIAIFFKALLMNPREMGAIFPSSHWLATEMASHALLEDDGLVIELGPGTGAITKALFEAGVNPANLIAVEYSHDLVVKLCSEFPTLQVIEGNAVNLRALLSDYFGDNSGDASHKVSTIISSLPLRSLPESVTQAILQEIAGILPVGSKYIQFTYSVRQNNFESLIHYRHHVSKWIWFNLPPARVDVFTI